MTVGELRKLLEGHEDTDTIELEEYSYGHGASEYILVDFTLDQEYDHRKDVLVIRPKY